MKLTDTIKLSFIDINPYVVNAMAKYFAKETNCEFLLGDILDFGGGTLISPANSIGNMDGGIDKIYSDAFPDVEDRLIKYIRENHGGKLDIGEAQIVQTQNNIFPYIIFSPTIERPGDIATRKNIFLASRAIFSEVIKYNSKVQSPQNIDRLLIPGLGTYYGGLDPESSAFETYRGFKSIEKLL